MDLRLSLMEHYRKDEYLRNCNCKKILRKSVETGKIETSKEQYR